MSIDVFVIECENSDRTIASAEFAAQRQDDLDIRVHRVSNVDSSQVTADLVHIVSGGGIVMPEFYGAMKAYLESSNRDYVTCPALSISGGNDKGIEGVGNMIIKSWVIKEIGGIDDLKNRVVFEYRGVEIPHFLYMEI